MNNVKVELEITVNYTDKISYRGDDIRVAEALVELVKANEVKED